MPESAQLAAGNLITIEDMPRISELLSALLRQLQLTGLLIQYFATTPKEATESFLERFGDRPALVSAIASILESYMPGKFSVSTLPVVSNHVRWSDPKKLAGFLSVKLDELLASYLGCWQNVTQYPDSAPFRFLRLSFFYWRECGDVFGALKLLLGLSEAGFLLRLDDVIAVALQLCDAYTTDFNIASLKNHDFNSAVDDAILAGKLLGIEAKPHVDEKIRALFDWVSDYAFEISATARQASNADEWMSQQAAMKASVDLLRLIDRKHRARLSATQRAIGSQFEEIGADLTAGELMIKLAADQGEPLVYDFPGIAGVGLAYMDTYGPTWIENMMEDRIIAPDGLRQCIEEAYAGAKLPEVRQLTVPSVWRMASEESAWSLCAAFALDLTLQRSLDFKAEEVEATWKELGYSVAPDSIFTEENMKAQAAARRELAIREFSDLFEDPGLFAADPAGSAEALKKLEAFALLYPWNYVVRRELGIRYDQAGDVAGGFRQMRAAVLLEPTDAMNWQSLSVILNRLEAKDDAIFASGISRMISQRTTE